MELACIGLDGGNENVDGWEEKRNSITDKPEDASEAISLVQNGMLKNHKTRRQSTKSRNFYSETLIHDSSLNYSVPTYWKKYIGKGSQGSIREIPIARLRDTIKVV